MFAICLQMSESKQKLDKDDKTSKILTNSSAKDRWKFYFCLHVNVFMIKKKPLEYIEKKFIDSRIKT